MGDATRIIRATLTGAVDGTPLHAGPVFAAPFHVAGDPGAAAYSYGRSHNPTWTALERAIALLEGEGAEVRVFGSGLAAVAAVFAAVLRAGDTVVVPGGMYFGARQLLEEVYGPAGVRVRSVAVEALVRPESLAGARLVWVETPMNPGLEVTDIRAVAAAAEAAGALLAVDNTTATPFSQKPLDLGAQLSVCSDSKAMCGHSDLLLGHVAVRDAELLATLDRQRTLGGAIAGPMEAWLLLRSLATLPLRLERSSHNAHGVAEFLRTQPGVSDVRYPGLASASGHAVAKAQMRYFGPVLGFTLAGQAAADRFLARCALVTEATSFGGISTTAERRARWGHDGVAPGFIRMSVGCEEIGDLLEDLAQALEPSGE